MLTIYHNNRCSKSREACELIEDKRLKVQVRDYINDPPTEAELVSLLGMLGMKASELVRRKDALYLEKYAGKKMTEKQWIKAMTKDPSLIERPIIVKNGKAIIGRPIEAVRKFLTDKKKKKD